MNFGYIIDKVTENLSRLKTVGILVLIVAFIISFVNNGCNRSELVDITEKLTGLNFENDLLKKDNQYQDSLLKVKNDSIETLNLKIALSDRKTMLLEAENRSIKSKYYNLAEELRNIPVDDSYAFLDTIAYPYPGEKKYPFNEPQVKGMHQTYLENEQLVALNNNLNQQKGELLYRILLNDTLYMKASSQMMIMEEVRDNLEGIIENKDEEIEIKDKQLKKEKNRSRWKIVGVAIVGVLIGFAAG